MSLRDEGQKAVFDVRQINVTKIDRVVDCDIGIAEADHSLRMIARQLADTSFNHDRDWLADAKAAKADIEHKRAMMQLKRDGLLASRSYQQDVDARNTAGKISLRDHLAGQALVAYLSRPDADEHAYEVLAGWSYKAADAMVAVRQQSATAS